MDVSKSPKVALLKRKRPHKSERDEDRPPKVFIPDVLARWPWQRRINPHYATVEKESDAWTTSLGAFSPRAQHAFNICYFSRLASLAYPLAKKEHVRAGCDLANVMLLVDEYTDVSEPSEVQKQKEIIMDALRNPHKPRPEGESIVGEIIRQFWERTIKNASMQSQKRLIAAFDEHLDGIKQQAIDRSEHRIRDIKSYFEVRRKTIGTVTGFALLEQALEIPDEIISHPTIQEMALAVTDMVILTNDIMSYNVEQSRGDDDHNIVRIVMNEFGTDVNGAILWVQDSHTKVERKFHAAMAALPQWDEPLNSQVKEYCDGLGNSVRANYEWSFESERYFGKRGREVMENGWMNLIPKRNLKLASRSEVGPVQVDSSLL